MTCDVCGNERFAMIASPVRLPDYELREARCTQCGTVFLLRTVLHAFRVIDPKTLNSVQIPIEHLPKYREYMSGRGPHPKGGGLDDA